jgi:hypothetical protein
MSIKVYSSGIQNDISNNASELFINDMEGVYQTHSIYRGIVATNLNREEEYKELLEKNTHTVCIIHTVDDIDYETLDSRVLVMDYLIFKEFVKKVLYNKDTSYNFIGIAYDIDNEIKDELIAFYNNVSKYKSDVIII